MPDSSAVRPPTTAVRPPSGTISQLVIRDTGCTFSLSGEEGNFELSKQHANYNAVFSGLLMAASNGFEVTVNYKDGTRVVDFVTLRPEV